MNEGMSKFLTQIYHALILILGGYLANEFSVISHNLQTLTSTAAVLVERTSSQSARLERLEIAVFKSR